MTKKIFLRYSKKWSRRGDFARRGSEFFYDPVFVMLQVSLLEKTYPINVLGRKFSFIKSFETKMKYVMVSLYFDYFSQNQLMVLIFLFLLIMILCLISTSWKVLEGKLTEKNKKVVK